MAYSAGNGGTTSEQVNYSYHPQMALKDVLGDFSYAYVQNLSYDAAGRLVQRQSGAVSGYVAVAQYAYYSWGNQGGRLQQITAGVPADLTSLQDLQYTYDWIGNVETIEDHKVINPQTLLPQTQTFSYDALYRLTGAIATGGPNGAGDYDESASNNLGYDYNTANGNLAKKHGVTYTYGGSHFHAVTALSNGNSYGYDANGNPSQAQGKL
jgi:hypothetical protein